MSRLNINELVNVSATDGPNFPLGLSVEGYSVDAADAVGTKYVATKAAGVTLASSLPDGATVIVTADESQGGVRVRYTVASGVLGSAVLDTTVMAQFTPSGSGAVTRTAQEKLRDIQTVKDFGALGNNTGDDAAFVQASPAPYRFPNGTYRLTSSIKYRKDSLWQGSGKSFNGTVLIPTGDFPALEPDTSVAIDYTKNSFSDFNINASNITTDYALKINGGFLTEFNRIWIRQSTKGVSITNSDSITFRDLMVMEDSSGDAVLVGDGARSIKFYSCNFEKNPGNVNPGGVVRINGVASFVASASFYGCQLERGALTVDSGTGKWLGGKVGAQCTVTFGPRSLDCRLDSDIDDASSIYDFGYNNQILSAYSQNMQTPIFKWPSIIPETNVNTVGTAGDEYLFCVSAGSFTTSAVTNGRIVLKEGATTLAQSPLFNLQARGVSVGLTKRPSYTFISCVRSTSVAIGPTFTNCSPFAVRGGRNLLSNGTFVGGITGWSLTGATSAQDGNDDTVVTPSGAWRLLQTMTNRLIPGRRYIAMAKFTGSAQLVVGNAADGSSGARPSYDIGVQNVYDTDTLAQVAFEFKTDISPFISIGATSNGGAVTVRWVALIEMDEPAPALFGSKTFDPPSIAASAQSSTTVTVTGAQLGDMAIASFGLDTQGIELSAYVSAANTVTVLFKNGTAAPIDLASSILRCRVVSRP